VPIIGAQLTIENTAPNFDELENVFIEQKPFTYYLSASDLEKSSLTFSSDSELVSINTVSKIEGIVQVLPSVKNIGIHNINFEVSDGELSNSEAVTFIILPQKFSTKFALDKSRLDFVSETQKTIQIKNLDEVPLYVLIDTPDFIDTLSAAYAEDTREIIIQSNSEENLFGIITFRSPQTSIDVPIFNTQISNFEGDITIINVTGLSIGKNTKIRYNLTREISEEVSDVKLTATLFSGEGKILAKRLTSIIFSGTEYSDELSFSIPSELDEDTYGLILTLTQNEKTSVAYQSIELTKGLPVLPTPLLNYAIIGVGLILFLKLIKHNKHHLKKIHRVHKKHSLFIKRQKVAKNKETRLRTKLNSLNKAYELGSITKKNYHRAKSHFYKRIKRTKKTQDKI
jgi:hypothetical protein